MMRVRKNIIKFVLVGFVSLSLILSIYYVITMNNSDSEKMVMSTPLITPSNSHTGEKRQDFKPNSKNVKHASEKTVKEPAASKVKEKSNESLTPEGIAENDRIVEWVGLSEDELKALHVRQKHEIKMMSEDMGSIVIGSVEDGSAGITLGELLALHEQQMLEINYADSRDEIVIPASENGDLGLSRDELETLHKQQNYELNNRDDWDETVIPASENGDPGLSRDELETLQDQQNYEIWEGSANFDRSVSPSPEEGGPNLSVNELKELHKRQSPNKQKM
jgi:hypothetical protein